MSFCVNSMWCKVLLECFFCLSLSISNNSLFIRFLQPKKLEPNFCFWISSSSGNQQNKPLAFIEKQILTKRQLGDKKSVCRHQVMYLLFDGERKITFPCHFPFSFRVERILWIFFCNLRPNCMDRRLELGLGDAKKLCPTISTFFVWFITSQAI